MSRALLSFFVAFCFFAQGYGGNPEEEVPCKDAQTCRNLEETKNNAYRQLQEAFNKRRSELDGIRNVAKDTQSRLKNYRPDVDKMAAQGISNVSTESVKAFQIALQQGKELPVFECIVDCEVKAKLDMMLTSNVFKNKLTLQKQESLKMIDDVVLKVNAIQSKLADTLKTYEEKIRRAITQIGVNWNREAALKEFDTIMNNSEKLREEITRYGKMYENSASKIFENCVSSFAEIIQGAKRCMNGCLGN